MNLILLFPDDFFDPETVTVADQRAEHIREILHPQVGDRLRVGLVNGPMGTGEVLSIDNRAVSLKISLTGPSPEVPWIDLLLALPRPMILRKVLNHVAAMGISRLFLVNANRVQKSYFTSSLLQNEAYLPFLHQGLEQAMHTYLPQVFLYNRFRPFIQDTLPELTADCQLKLLAHPEGTQSLWQAANPPIRKRVLLAVGPEGGWVDFEVQQFMAQGFTPFTMGARILRVDTAVPALLGQLTILAAKPDALSDLTPPPAAAPAPCPPAGRVP